MFSLLQNRHPLAFLFLIPLAGLLGFIHFWFAEESMTLTFSVWQKVFELKSDLITYGYISLLAMNGIVLSALFNRLNLIDYFSHISGLFYVVLSFASVSLNEIHLLLADFFVLMGFLNLVQIKNNVDAKAPAFNAALFLGISCLINIYYVPFLLLPFLTLVRTRSFVFREFVAIIMAWSVLSSYVAFYYYYFQLSILKPIPKLAPKENLNYYQVVLVISVLLLVLLSFATRNRFQGSPGIRIERIIRTMFAGIALQIVFHLAFTLLKLDYSMHGAVFLALYAGYAYHLTKIRFVYHLLTYTCIIAAVLQHLDFF